MNTRSLVAIGIGALTLAACGGNTSSRTADQGPVPTPDSAGACAVGSDQRLALATGNATGVYFALGTALAEQVAQATGNKIRVTAAETGASVQNIEQLVAGDYQVAFSLLDTASDAIAGKGAFEGKPASLAALARTHTNYTHVVVRKAAKISSLADLKGKRVSTGSPKSGTEVIANRLLQAAGLDPDSDVKAQRLDLTKTVDGMKSGQIDALFWSGGLPTPGINDLLLTSPRDTFAFLDVTGELADLAQLSPAYQSGSIPAGTYIEGSPAVPTIVVPNVLLVRPDLAAPTACALTKALLDRRAELAQVNAAAKEIDPTRAGDTAPVPLHPGAAEAIAAAGGSTAPSTPAATTPTPTTSASPTPTGTATSSPTPSASHDPLGVSADLNLPPTY